MQPSDPSGAASVHSVLGARSGSSAVMIGRHLLLDRLLGLIDSADVASADGPAIALVSGEAGIGKTRLLRELVATLPADVGVLSAQARPGSMGRSFDVIGQLCTPGENPPDAATRTIEAPLAKGRVLLIVEDLHWADADSVHFLEQICMQPWPQLTIIGTYRSTDLLTKSPGGELVLRLERQHTIEQIRIDRLDRIEVASMLGAIGSASPSSGAVEAVFRRSGGVPFVIEELMRCCGPDACTDDLKTSQLPWSLNEAVRQQVNDLPADERRVIDALAVFGDPAPFEVLMAVGELPEERLQVALTSLVAQSTVVESVDDTFWFAHALVADAVQQQLLGRERRRLHERSLATLKALPEPDHAALARHALGAGQFDLVPGIAREGARRYLDRGASFQALRLASAALAEAPTDTELLSVATDAAWRLEFGREALEYAMQWHTHAVTDLERVESLRFVGRLHFEAGNIDLHNEVVAKMELSANELPMGLARGRCAGAVAQLHMIADRHEQAIVWADRALADARRIGDPWLEAQASLERASAFGPMTSRADAEQALLSAREMARQVGDGVLECRALNNLLNVVAPQDAIGVWARNELRQVSARYGLDKLGWGLLTMWEGYAALIRGDMPALRKSIAEAGRWSFENGAHCQSRVLLAELRIEEGLLNEALEALAMIEAAPGSDHIDAGRRVRLTAAALSGNRAEAERVFDELVRCPPLPNLGQALWLMVELVQVALMAGVAPQRVRAELVDGWAKDHVLHGSLQRLVEGLLAAANADPTRAVAAFEVAFDDLDSWLSIPTLALLRTDHAAALLASGDRIRALEQANQAVELLASWPGWRRDRAEAIVRRLQGSGTRTDGDLTAREVEVAALVAEGLTNSALAERLFISPRTAAVHVSNILMKLGLSSRAEIAAWVVRHELVLHTG
jgi:DNA-binding CsgD family transcriptional regulator